MSVNVACDLNVAYDFLIGLTKEWKKAKIKVKNEIILNYLEKGKKYNNINALIKKNV